MYLYFLQYILLVIFLYLYILYHIGLLILEELLEVFPILFHSFH
nr:MAG TPA: hypothetical protein [Caudoviricetes sp.]